MTTEEKELLLKDLSARLPYGVRCNIDCPAFIASQICVGLHAKRKTIVTIYDNECDVEYAKPYLFPLSSMTEEQEESYRSKCEVIITEDDNIYLDTVRSIDWLNKNHFDYRGLIGRGLAIDATNLNIYS